MVTKKTTHFRGTGLEPAEKKWAGRRFNEYKANYNIGNFSDLQLLEEIVWREVLQERYKKSLEDKPDARYIQNNLNDNLSQILILKEKLGLFETKKEDEYKAFKVLENKFDIWKKEHIEERKVTCPFCSEIFFLNIRTDKYTESKLKLFKNKILCNEHLWKIYKEKKITKEEFAEILNVSPDYIDFLESKIYNKPSK